MNRIIIFFIIIQEVDGHFDLNHDDVRVKLGVCKNKSTLHVLRWITGILQVITRLL